MNTNSPLEPLIEKARDHRPFGDPVLFGFETRLRSALAEQMPPGLEMMGRLSWRFTIACFPLLVFAAIFVGVQNSGFLPDGLGGVVSQWSILIPVDLL